MTCSPEARNEAMEQKFCGLMKDEEGPFSECLRKVSHKGHLDSCVYDVCVNEGHVTIMRELACAALYVMNQECMAAGVPAIGWEVILGCGETF